MPLTSDLSQKLLCEVITIIDQDVILVSQVPLTHLRNQHVLNLEFCLSQDGYLTVTFVSDRDCILKHKGTVPAWRYDINATLMRKCIPTVGILMLTYLNSCVICAKA